MVPVDAAVGCSFYQVAFRGNVMFLEGLEEQVRLARRDDGVFRVVHEQHRRTGDWGGGRGWYNYKNCLLRPVPRREAVGDGYEEDGTGYVAGRDEA